MSRKRPALPPGLPPGPPVGQLEAPPAFPADAQPATEGLRAPTGKNPDHPVEDNPRFYTIRIQGRLHERWKDWFGGMTITNLDQGEALIEGWVQDQSVLVGVINQVHGLNLRLISVHGQDSETAPA